MVRRNEFPPAPCPAVTAVTGSDVSRSAQQVQRSTDRAEGQRRSPRGSAEEEEEEAQLPWPGCTLLREPIHALEGCGHSPGRTQRTPLQKVETKAAPERPEIPGASSWASTAQKMWLLLCKAGLSPRVHRGKDLTQDHTPHPLPLAPTQTHPILQHLPTNHRNLHRAPDSIRNRQLNCLVVQGNTSRFFFPASELYLFI